MRFSRRTALSRCEAGANAILWRNCAWCHTEALGALFAQRHAEREPTLAVRVRIHLAIFELAFFVFLGPGVFRSSVGHVDGVNSGVHGSFRSASQEFRIRSSAACWAIIYLPREEH
jgi:hypothetical protein